MTRHTRSMFTALIATTFLAVAFGIGSWRHFSGAANAEVRPATPQTHFKSGGARSEIVLIEIAEILKRIDTRLERIERTIAQAAENDNNRSSE